jgi:hypothetical protein
MYTSEKKNVRKQWVLSYYCVLWWENRECVATAAARVSTHPDGGDERANKKALSR